MPNPPRTISILAGADFHGDRAVLEWFVEAAAKVLADAVVLAGDLLGHPDGYPTVEEAQRADSRYLVDLFERLEVPVLYIMGNDDFIELESPSANRQITTGRLVPLPRGDECGDPVWLLSPGAVCRGVQIPVRGTALRDSRRHWAERLSQMRKASTSVFHRLQNVSTMGVDSRSLTWTPEDTKARW